MAEGMQEIDIQGVQDSKDKESLREKNVLKKEVEPYWERNFIAESMADEASVIARYRINPDSLKDIDLSGKTKLTDEYVAKLLSKITVNGEDIEPPKVIVSPEALDEQTIYNLSRLTLGKEKALEEITSNPEVKSRLRQFGEKLRNDVSVFLSGEVSSSRRVFMRTMLIGALAIMLTACGPGLPALMNIGSEIPAAALNESTMDKEKNSLEQYFENKGVVFEHEQIKTPNKEVEIYNGSNMNVDVQKIAELYEFFESLNNEPFKYRLTNGSQEVTVTPTIAEWQKKGTLFIVPWDADLPEEFARLRNTDAFTDYEETGDQFITIIRIPTEAKAHEQGGLTPEQYVLAPMTVEAAQTSVYVKIDGSYGLGLPAGEERFWTQEAFCNSFWYAVTDRMTNTPYDPLLFATTTVPSGVMSNGNSYDLRIIFISKDKYNSIPANPFLSKP